MSDRLSQRLLSQADQEVHEFHDDLPPEERDEYWRTKKLVEKIVKLVVVGREKITTANIQDIEALLQSIPDALEDWLDEFHTRISLEECPKRVQRTLELTALTARYEPSLQTHRYVSEATRAYILGLDMSAVAMSRAALEQALKERLGRQGDGNFVEFKQLVSDARTWNILSATGASAARAVGKECNALLHEKPHKDDEAAFQVLLETRSLLEEIYSAEGGY